MTQIFGPGLVPPPGFDEIVWLDPEKSFPVRTPSGILDLMGCSAVRMLPTPLRGFPQGPENRILENRILAVERLLFGQARLCIGRPEMMVLDGNFGGWDDQWEYPTLLAAVVAMAHWEPDKDAEPSRWTRHQPSGRRRPGGDPEREEVRR